MLAAVVVVGGVLLTRGGTAATEADLVPPTPAPEPETARPEQDVLEATGLGPFRLGSPVATGGDGPWYATGVTSRDGGCRYLQGAWQPGEVQVSGWEVDGEVVSVALRTYAAAGAPFPSELGVSFGDGVEGAALLPDAVLATEQVPRFGALRYVTVPSGAGTETVVSDLGEDAGIRYVEVRSPTGRDCVADFPWAALPSGPPPELPVLDAAGRGPLRYGQPDGELPALGLTASDEQLLGMSGCDVWRVDGPLGPAEDIEGVAYVLVRDGTLVGISLWSGGTSEGLFVGAPLAQLVDAYPEVSLEGTEGYPGAWQPLRDGRLVQVAAFPGFVAPDSVDAEVQTDEQLIGELTVLSAPCSG